MTTTQEERLRYLSKAIQYGAPMVHARIVAGKVNPVDVFEAARAGIISADDGARILQLHNEALSPWWVRAWRAFWWG